MRVHKKSLIRNQKSEKISNTNATTKNGSNRVKCPQYFVWRCLFETLFYVVLSLPVPWEIILTRISLFIWPLMFIFIMYFSISLRMKGYFGRSICVAVHQWFVMIWLVMKRWPQFFPGGMHGIKGSWTNPLLFHDIMIRTSISSSIHPKDMRELLANIFQRNEGKVSGCAVEMRDLCATWKIWACAFKHRAHIRVVQKNRYVKNHWKQIIFQLRYI